MSIHIEALSNGLGSQSMYLCVLAAEGRIPATVSITADTGSELDRVRSDGRRTTAEEYLEALPILKAKFEKKKSGGQAPDFGCGNSFCGV